MIEIAAPGITFMFEEPTLVFMVKDPNSDSIVGSGVYNMVTRDALVSLFSYCHLDPEIVASNLRNRETDFWANAAVRAIKRTYKNDPHSEIMEAFTRLDETVPEVKQIVLEWYLGEAKTEDD